EFESLITHHEKGSLKGCLFSFLYFPIRFTSSVIVVTMLAAMLVAARQIVLQGVWACFRCPVTNYIYCICVGF
ncbi:hypothetical protein, partial [Thalassospira profundimaris]|uniref:hypothetical protein n=1 Tax=Thalassospira profundimaris TaxID=502049 RepID=UPI001C693959